MVQLTLQFETQMKRELSILFILYLTTQNFYEICFNLFKNYMECRNNYKKKKIFM